MSTYKSKTASSKKEVGLKIKCQNKDCPKMGRYQTENNFYLSHNPQMPHHPFCKECVNDSVDMNNIDTIYNILKSLDIPFIFDIWADVVKKGSKNCLERYFKILNGKKYINTHWGDSIFEEDKNFIPQSHLDEIPLWDDEWQGNYTKSELDYLNNYLDKLKETFDITNVNYIDYAKKIANASLIEIKARNTYQGSPTKENFAMWKDANTMFDNLSKSAKFSENTRTANDIGLGSFGQIFDAVEKHNYIPSYIPEDKDMYDKLLEQFSNVEKSL